MNISRIAFSAPLLVGIALLQTSCGDSSGPGNVATAIVANSSTTLAAAPGAPVAEPPSVIVSDQNNQPLAGVHVIFAVTSGGGSITGANVTTGVNGVATVGSWTLGTSGGSNTLTATVANLPPVLFTANGADPCIPATTHALGTTTNGELTKADCDLGDGSFVDYYAVTLSAATTLVFNQTSSEFNAYLWLFDVDANLIGINDNFGGSSDSRIKAILPAGTYVIGANSLEINVTGKYALTSSSNGGAVTNCEVVFVVKGSASTESLQTTDCPRNTNFYEDRYIIFLTAGQSITVSMNSSTIDSYLSIYASGNPTALAQNDDKDQTTKDALLPFTAPATGFYFIVPGSTSAGVTGPYSFMVQ